MPFSRWAVFALALLPIVIVSYSPLLAAYFKRDDFIWLAVARQWERRPEGPIVLLKGDYGATTVFNVVHAALYRLGGITDPRPYYWWLILSHWGASLAVLALGVRIVGVTGGVLAALAFACFWGNHQGVNCIAGGYRPLVSALLILAVFFYIRFRDTGRGRLLVASAVAGLLALFTKEDALSLILLIPPADYFLFRRAPRRRPQPAAYAVFVGLYAIYALAQPSVRTVGGDGSGYHAATYNLGPHALRNTLDCVPQMLFPDFSRGGFRELAARVLPEGMVGAAAVASVALRVAFNLGALWLLIRGPGAVRFLVAWMYLTFLPFSFFVYEYAVSARYRYLPAVALCLLIGYGVAALHRRLADRRLLRTMLWGAVGIAAVANILMLRQIQGDLARDGELRRAVVEEFARRKPPVPPGTRFRFEGLPKSVQDAVLAVRMLYDVPVTGLRPVDAGEANVVVTFEGARIVDIAWRTPRVRSPPP